MIPQRLYAQSEVRQDLGRAALWRGPLIYCCEQHDNDASVHRARLPRTTELSARFDRTLVGGIMTLVGQALEATAAEWEADLYRTRRAAEAPAPMVAVPWSAWCKRGPHPMQVWLRR